MFKTALFFLIAGCLLAVPALPAKGGTITYFTPYSFTYSLADALGDTSSGAAVKGAARNTSIDPLAVAAFDSSLGTLTGITISLQLSLSSAQFILHDSFDSPNSSVLQIWAFDAGYVLTPASGVSGSFFTYGSVDAATSTNYLIRTGANDLGSFSASKTDTKALSLSNYASMQNGGQLLFQIYLSGDITISDTHPLFRYLSAEGEATLSGLLFVTYEYDAVPEPGSVFLFLVGMLPLARRFDPRKETA
jgi:hypothetical protein